MRRGFSIIELLVSVGIFSLLIPMLFLVFFSTVSLYMQTTSLQRIKDQGDYMRSAILNKVRNDAYAVIDNCSVYILELGSTACFQSSSLVTSVIYFGYLADNSGNMYYYENNNYPTSTSATVVELMLDASLDTDFPLKVHTPGNLVSEVDTANGTSSFNFTVDFVPKNSVTPAESLQYAFYVTLRQY